jgi:hypothetical protein
MSSPDHNISRTIFSFAIGWVEIKIFHFWDIGLEVERSQLIVRKISKWVFGHHFFSPPRTHINLWNRIWMSITHSIIVRRFTSYRLEGRWRVKRRYLENYHLWKLYESLSVQMSKIWTWYHIPMHFMVSQTIEFDEHGPDSLKSMHGRWNFVKNSKKLTWVHMKDFHF